MALARLHPKFRRIIRQLGVAGYAYAFMLLEIVAQYGGSGAEFNPLLDLNDAAADLDWLGSELDVSTEDLKRILDVFASVQFIDADAWKQNKVSIPAMLELRDEWTARKAKPREQLPSDSGERADKTPEALGSNSPMNRVRDRAEPEQSKRQSRAKKAGADALPSWLPIPEWNAWLEMRLANRWKLTKHAKALAITKLDELRKQGHDPAQVLNQSVLNSWRGLFAIKPDFGGSNGRSRAEERTRRNLIALGLLDTEPRRE